MSTDAEDTEDAGEVARAEDATQAEDDAGAKPEGGPPAERPGGSSLAIVAWGLSLYAGCRAIDIFLEAQALAAAVGQAVLVEWGSARLGVSWSEPSRATTTAAIARRALLGAAIGAGMAATLFAILVASKGVTTETVTQVEPSVLAIGFITAALHAWRDELLLHGITLRALEGASIGAPGRVLACGITSAGAALGRSDATARTVFAAFLLGIVLGALWVRDRGAWQPWAAHAAFRWTTGTVLAGGLVHSRLATNAWAGGSDGVLGGTAATIALVPVALLAMVWAVRRISPRSARVG